MHNHSFFLRLPFYTHAFILLLLLCIRHSSTATIQRRLLPAFCLRSGSSIINDTLVQRFNDLFFESPLVLMWSVVCRSYISTYYNVANRAEPLPVQLRCSVYALWYVLLTSKIDDAEWRTSSANEKLWRCIYFLRLGHRIDTGCNVPLLERAASWMTSILFDIRHLLRDLWHPSYVLRHWPTLFFIFHFSLNCLFLAVT